MDFHRIQIFYHFSYIFGLIHLVGNIIGDIVSGDTIATKDI